MGAFWIRLNTLLLLVVLLALSATIGILASRIEGGPLDPPTAPNDTDAVQLPGTPVTGPTTIVERGHYYLTRNVNSGAGTPIITIATSHVTLDLNGFGIHGSDTINSVGVLVGAGHANVEIRNGTVSDFHVGIKSPEARYVRIKDVRAVSNIRGVELGSSSLLEDCSLVENSEAGLYAGPTTFNSRIENCQVMFNQGRGVQFDGIQNLIANSYIRNNQAGFDVHLVGNKNVVRGNYLGELAVDGQTNVVMDNACITATSNSGGVSNIINPTHNPNVTCFP